MGIESLQNFIDPDSDKEEYPEEEEALNPTIEILILRMEVRKWKNQEDEYQEGMVSFTEHKKTIRRLDEKWVEERITKRLREEELQNELREMKKFQSMQKEKEQMYALSQELLGTRVPSSSYPIFLFEQFVWFKLRAMKEGRSFEITTSARFLETFLRSNFEDQNLLCELYLHERACTMDRHSNRVPFSRDVQLRDFASFVRNHA